MKEIDRKLMEAYRMGFEYELSSSTRKLEDKAFKLGRLHALVGDDVSSVDLLSAEEILKEIKG